MPSPFGHSLMGYIIYRGAGRPYTASRWQDLLLYLFAANAADLDFIPGFLAGDPNRFHHGISHSLGFAVLFALAFSFLLELQKREPFRRNFAIFFSLYFSHIALDYFSIDVRLPYGEPFLWPLSDDYYMAPFAFLPGIERSSSGIEFIPSLFSFHNLWAVTVECLLLLPLALFIVGLRTKAARKVSSSIESIRSVP